MNQGIVQAGVTPMLARPPQWPFNAHLLLASQTITAPGPGWMEFVVLGAGGSGALSLQGNVDTRAQGGCSGGTAIKRVRVRGGERFALTLGAGGTARSSSGVTTLNGNQGGTTTLVGPGVNIVIPGGLGGDALANSAASISVKARSIPVGGDINLPGGVAGAISGVLATSGMATGGAGPALLNVFPDSGSIDTAAAQGSATGGAGLYPSGSLTGGSRVTGGGGARSASADNSATAGEGSVFGASSVTFANFFYGTIAIAVQGTNGSVSTTTTAGAQLQWGGGTGGWSTDTAGNAGDNGDATFGGGGAVATNSTAFNLTAGSATYVGGGGGAAITDATAGTSWSSGAGGQAIAFVAFFPETH